MKEKLNWDGDSDPCKKGTRLEIHCVDCHARTDTNEIFGRCNAFLKCPRCGGFKFIIFRSTQSIHDYCNNCEYDCKNFGGD